MHIKKLSIVIILIFLMITYAHAEPYFGINAGGNVVTIAKELNYVQTNSNLSSYYTGFRGQILAGWNFYTLDKNISYKGCAEKFYFSIEADANYNTGNASTNINPWFLSNNASASEKLNYGYDIFILGKYRYVPNVILFLGPGISRGNFNVNTSSTAGNLGISGNDNSWINGWSIKAGIEIPLTYSLNIVATYQYTTFSSLSLTRIEPLTGDGVTAKYKPRVNSLTIGINFSNLNDLISQNNQYSYEFHSPNTYKRFRSKQTSCSEESCTTEDLSSHCQSSPNSKQRRKLENRGNQLSTEIQEDNGNNRIDQQEVYFNAFP